jgi:hypothetical protein
MNCSYVSSPPRVKSRDNASWRKAPVETMLAKHSDTLSIKSLRSTIVLARIIPSNSSTTYSYSGVSGREQGCWKSDVEPDRPLALLPGEAVGSCAWNLVKSWLR